MTDSSRAPLPSGAPPPRVLLVTAHPDDETLFGGTAWLLSHVLGGMVDLAVFTDGEGGYRYATLAEPLYGLKLTDSAIARVHLPRIRRQELLASARILGLRRCIFLEQPDSPRALEAAAPLEEAWDTSHLRERLRQLMTEERYDFAFVMLPVQATHPHHRASALLALEAIEGLAPPHRPLVLGASVHTRREEVPAAAREGFPIPRAEGFTYSGVEGHPLAAPWPDALPFEFDRTRRFGHGGRLDFHVVVNWAIAEHKTQGLMQQRLSLMDVERYWYLALNPESGLARARALFERLATAEP